MRVLLSISAFWRNDQRQGVGVTMTNEAGNLDYLLSVLMELYEEMYREAVFQSDVPALIKDLLAQLEAIGLANKSRPMPLHNVLLAIGNIWLLEKFGYLKSDEFNGLLLAYQE